MRKASSVSNAWWEKMINLYIYIDVHIYIFPRSSPNRYRTLTILMWSMAVPPCLKSESPLHLYQPLILQVRIPEIQTSTINLSDILNILKFWLIDYLIVFYVPSTARSFRDGTPIYCLLRRT